VTLRENGHGVLLRPHAVAADGTDIPVEHFPVTWATSDDKVVELFQTTDTTAQLTSHEQGRAAVTATLQGTTAAVNVEVVKMGTTVGPMQGATMVASAARRSVVITAPIAVTGTAVMPASAPVTAYVPLTAQPANFRASSGPGYVVLQWDTVPGATGYTLARLENGVATPLDDHYPAGTPRLERSRFFDVQGPGTTVGYVLSAIYRAPDGTEYAGDAAAQPRTAATPLPLEAGTNAAIEVTGFANESNTLWVDYRTPAALGWVSAIALEVMEPSGWRQVNGHSFSWTSADARYRAVPGPRSGRLSLDPNIPLGCDHVKTFRFKVTRSVGGDTAPQQQVGVDLSRPFGVTYDNSGSRCHQ
jgi:hypothetical protein